MASLEKRTYRKGERYRLVFRLHGRKYNQVLNATTDTAAERILSAAERTIELIEEGRVKIPAGADVGLFVVTDGRVEKQPTRDNTLPLGKLYDLFTDTLPSGTQEKSTLVTTRIHLTHVARMLGEKLPLASITTERLQQYVNKRLAETNKHGKTISPCTVRKEIVTLGSIWSWASRNGKVPGIYPGRGLRYPKTTEKVPFQTWKEIEKQVEQGGSEELWSCLFLSRTEIDELIEHVRKNAVEPYIYPMVVVAAHTGARRSELIRSQLADIDFTSKTIVLHEKKREKGHLGTRRVPMSPVVAKVLKAWVARHPGGPTFYQYAGQSVLRDRAHDHLQRTLKDGKWNKIRGWHVLRHSFASNCAAAGIDQRIIDSWMGHQTVEMQKRYRHHFPDQQRDAMQLVFGRR